MQAGTFRAGRGQRALCNLSLTFLPPPGPKTMREACLSRSQHCNHSQNLESIVVQMGAHTGLPATASPPSKHAPVPTIRSSLAELQDLPFQSGSRRARGEEEVEGGGNMGRIQEII